MSPDKTSYRILIVDDDEHVLLSLQWLLENEGHTTTLAWSGAEAQALLARGCFDLVLVDAELRDVSAPDLVGFAHLLGTNPSCVLLHPSTRLQQIDAVCNLAGPAAAYPAPLVQEGS